MSKEPVPPFTKKFDMDTRGPKVMTKITPVWSPEHEAEVKRFNAIREAARKQYGRS